MGRQLSVRTQSLSLLLLIALIGLNLRPFLVSPGPLLGSIVNDTGLSYPQASMLTLLPMMLMGFGAFVVAARPALIGSHVGLLLALGLMTLGSALRYFVSDGSTLIITALLCGVGVAFIQSILPGMIKQFFAQHSAVVTGLYSASLMIGGALGAQLMPILLQRGYRWQHALALLALPCFAALVAAWVVLNQRKQMPEQCDALPEVSQAPLSVPQLVSEAILSPLPLKRLLARPRTWTLMAAFGIVNGGYASLVTWLAPFYQQRGWDHASSSHLSGDSSIVRHWFTRFSQRLHRQTPLVVTGVSNAGHRFFGVCFLSRYRAAFMVNLMWRRSWRRIFINHSHSA